MPHSTPTLSTIRTFIRAHHLRLRHGSGDPSLSLWQISDKELDHTTRLCTYYCILPLSTERTHKNRAMFRIDDPLPAHDPLIVRALSKVGLGKEKCTAEALGVYHQGCIHVLARSSSGRAILEDYISPSVLTDLCPGSSRRSKH